MADFGLYDANPLQQDLILARQEIDRLRAWNERLVEALRWADTAMSDHAHDCSVCAQYGLPHICAALKEPS